jgi:ABC-type antimicrobial peptide transport system permease subunit
MSALDTEIGGHVVALANDGSRSSLRVVGTVVLAGFGTYPGSDKTALGEGTVVTQADLRKLGPDFNRRDYIIAFAPGATTAQRRSVLNRMHDAVGNDENSSFDLGEVRRPADILAYEKVRSTPVFLAGVLGLLALASVVHALVSVIRRRRRDLALLATLGFTRRQISSTVVWQATTMAVLGLAIGLPLGIVIARVGWTALANNLGTLPESVVPVLALTALALAAIVVLNLGALVPARLAARLRPGAVLRSE